MKRQALLVLVWMAACQSPDKADEAHTPADTGATGIPNACFPRDAVAPVADFFTDISESSGIRLGNYDPDPPEGTSINDHSRLAFADIDGDGFDDIVMHSLWPNAANGVPFEHLVFHNNGDGTFADVSDHSGLRDIQAGFFAFADVDDDGDQDVYAGLDLPGLGDSRSGVLLNDGSGVFTPLAESGVAAASSTAAGAVFGDFDGDGHVDLYVGNGGTSYGAADQLYLGTGDGTFTEDTSALESPPSQPTNGIVACDYDDDGDLDIFASNYGVSVANGHDTLWENDAGRFKNVATDRGFSSLVTGNYYLSENGYIDDPEPGVDAATAIGGNGFGIDCADIDGDGHLDIFQTNISHADLEYSRQWSDPSQLLLNSGPDGNYAFANAFRERGVPFNEGDIDGAILDFDNDGRLDLSVSREDKYEARYPDEEQHGWFGLMRQSTDGQFTSHTLNGGINNTSVVTPWGRMKRAQNHAWSDIDHDGDLDLLVGGRDQGGGRPNFLFRNDLGQDNRWIAIDLVGDGSAVHRDAFGARITFDWGEIKQVREKKSARGTYNSEDTRWQHIGLGDSDCDFTVTVRWPNGTTVELDPNLLGEERYVRIAYPDAVTPL
jgi:hypothetical protein